MRFVLFRHGIAVDRDDPACPPDPERPLTDRGVDRTRRAARGLASLLRPDLVLESPYVRARQTADLLVEAIGLPARARRVSETLTPDADVDGCLRLARDLDAQTVAFVGHAPHLDELLARVVGWDRPTCALKKAGAALATERTLHWILPPRVLRRLAEGAA